MRLQHRITALGLVAGLVYAASAQTPLGPSFTYQGQLKQGGQPFNGSANLVFKLYDATSGGNLLGTQALNNVSIAAGLFTVGLNGSNEFGANAFNGERRWLEVAVNGTTLSPRQELTVAPYATLATRIALPFNGSTNAAGAALAITNSSSLSGTFGAVGTLTSASGVDLTGRRSGVWGDSSSGDGVIGTSAAQFGAGVVGKCNNVGVYGTNPTGGAGVYGDSVSGYGVYGACSSGNGVYGTSVSSNGVFGVASGTTGTNYGVFGRTASSSGVGVHGEATNFATNTVGVEGLSPAGKGVYGVTALANDPNSAGVYGTALNSGGTGVIGVASGPGSHAVRGTSPEGFGVRGTASTGTGVFGESSSGPGVSGFSASHFGIIGTRTGGSGVDLGGAKSAIWGDAASGHGVIGTSAELYGAGVMGKCNNVGVLGINPTGGAGVYGTSATGYGVFGASAGNQGAGVRGEGGSGGTGVSAYVPSGIALFSYCGNGGTAGQFNGDVHVYGNLTKSSGSFRIDHPLDPANKYLQHSFVESPDMMNIYNGNVTTDDQGYAQIDLPDWFQALNQDFRYQLTVLDDADSDTFVQAKVVRKIQDNCFTIRTSRAHTEVSWQVTGIRQDAWANAHRIVVEEDKPSAERGTYQYPEPYGQPPEMGLHYRPQPQRTAAPEPEPRILPTPEDTDQSGRR